MVHLRIQPIVAGVLALVCVAGCTPAQSEAEESSRLIPQGLQQTLESLRDPWGMYVDAEYYQEPGAVYLTALLDGAVSGSSLQPVDLAALRETACAASAQRDLVGELWYAWAVSYFLGGDTPDCIESSQPEATGDASTDIPQVYAWVATQRARDRLVDYQDLALSAILDGASSVTSHYVLWRYEQIATMLGDAGMPQPKIGPPPEAIHGPEELIEYWGYVNRCAQRPDACDSSIEQPDPTHIAQVAISARDDLSLAAATSVLTTQDGGWALDEIMTSIAARTDRTTGLVRLRPFQGDVRTTFQVLRLDPGMFPGPVPERTAAELVARLGAIPAEDEVQRLQAIAVLNAVDPQLARHYDQEVGAIIDEMNSVGSSRASLRSDVIKATALGLMGKTVSPRMKVFTIEDAEDVHLARFAIGAWWVFANGDEVVERYADVRTSALEISDRPVEPVAEYIAALGALSGPGLQLNPEDFDRIEGAADRALKGCELDGEWNEFLYRSEIDRENSCSLDVVVEVAAAGFGVYP